MHNHYRFKKKIIAVCISACSLAVCGHVQAQEDSPVEEIVITGVRKAQENAVNIKREASSIVDAISAEDIGKLPDVTIADSLQRIGGVQIRRDAGEGGSVNVRGMAQVLTTFNGESYLGANSITSVQPNFTDIPSQLFSGAEIVKSQTANHHSGGISGIVNLKTYRPLDADFDSGLTLSGAAQVSRGQEMGETDPALNFLVNWRNDKMGFLLSVAHQKANLANYYSGLTGDSGWTGFPGENWAYDWVEPHTALGGFGSRLVDGGVDVNANGSLNDTYWSYEGHMALNRATERERNGINAAFQLELADGLELVAEAFYTDMDDYDRKMGVIHEDKWQRWGWFMPTLLSEKNAQANGRNLFTVQEYTGNGRRIKSFSEVSAYATESRNFNVELNYDNGGAFTGGLRYVNGRAELERLNSYMDIDLAHGNQWGVECQYYPPGTSGQQGDCTDGRLQTNPNGYHGFPVLTVNYAGKNPVWSGFDNNANLDIHGVPVAGVASRSIASYLESVDSYALGALTSENNYLRDGELDVIRFDGSYALDGGFLQSLDFGVRLSTRSVDNFEFDLLSPVGGCGVKWKATDVNLDGGGIEGACTYGDGNGNFYTAGIPTPISTLNPVQVSDFGSARGIPSVWVVDPASMQNVEAYHQKLYPGTYRSINPGRSYQVDLDELSYYIQANFATGIMSGNIGLRQVDTDLGVTQNQVGNPQPYGAANQKIGELATDSRYDDLLPSLNLRFDLADDVVVRGSVARTMAPLDLSQWGGALAPNYAIDSDPNSETYNRFIVINANADGNPRLKPWRATNYDLSVEYYLGTASALSLAWFYIDVQSFIESGSVQMALPDQDGVVRREVPVSTSVQGNGGVLRGVELGAKLAFSDIIDGPLSDFGVDINYTYSPSSSGNMGLNGKELPFQDNSENVFNAVVWYESGPVQARLAYNYRSERVAGFNQTWGEGTLWQKATGYVDLSASYDLTDNISLFINASNVTNERETYYLEFEDQFAYQFEYEARYTLGIRATF